VRPELSERFSRMSAYKLELNDASVDCVTLQEVLEHLEGAAQATKEINRVLKNGGILVLSVPNPFYVSAMLAFFRFELRNGFRRLFGGKPRLGTEVFYKEVEWNRHIFSWTPQTLLTLLVVNGFEYVAHRYENGMPNLIERGFLKLFPFMGPTQILKVRKIADAPASLI
jgi:ubiquinone/menaquinone biosynthesis C-methylase UbiE